MLIRESRDDVFIIQNPMLNASNVYQDQACFVIGRLSNYNVNEGIISRMFIKFIHVILTMRMCPLTIVPLLFIFVL